MNSIWTAYLNKTISAKEAFEQINKALVGASAKQQASLLKLSEKILNAEVPLTERNEEAEEAFTARTRRRDEE